MCPGLCRQQHMASAAISTISMASWPYHLQALSSAAEKRTMRRHKHWLCIRSRLEMPPQKHQFFPFFALCLCPCPMFIHIQFASLCLCIGNSETVYKYVRSFVRSVFVFLLSTFVPLIPVISFFMCSMLPLVFIRLMYFLLRPVQQGLCCF